MDPLLHRSFLIRHPHQVRSLSERPPTCHDRHSAARWKAPNKDGAVFATDTCLTFCRGSMTQLYRQLCDTMKFDDMKSETLNLRVSPSLKRAIKAAANHEQRSMGNMLDVLVAGFWDANGIAIPRQCSACEPRTVSRPGCD